MTKRTKRQPTSTGPKLPRSVKRLFPNVDDVTDSTRRVVVTVTARDSSNGKRLKATECAMAVAAKRDFQADGVVIGLSRSYIIKGNKAIRFATPSHVAREIVGTS
jgi:nucleosome binding factor SPN SPT16 subunit